MQIVWLFRCRFCPSVSALMIYGLAEDEAKWCTVCSNVTWLLPIYVQYVQICRGYFRPTEHAELSHRFHSKLAADRASLKKTPIINPFRLIRDIECEDTAGAERTLAKFAALRSLNVGDWSASDKAQWRLSCTRSPVARITVAFPLLSLAGGIQQNHAAVCMSLQSGESPCRLKHTHVNRYEEFVNWVVFSPNFNLKY